MRSTPFGVRVTTFSLADAVEYACVPSFPCRPNRQGNPRRLLHEKQAALSGNTLPAPSAPGQSCESLRPSEPFNVTWSHGNVKSSLTGVLREAEGGRYPLMLTVNQALTDRKMGSSTTEGYKLTLGTWKNSTDVVPSAFNDIEERDVLLVQGDCPNSTEGSVNLPTR